MKKYKIILLSVSLYLLCILFSVKNLETVERTGKVVYKSESNYLRSGDLEESDLRMIYIIYDDDRNKVENGLPIPLKEFNNLKVGDNITHVNHVFSNTNLYILLVGAVLLSIVVGINLPK